MQGKTIRQDSIILSTQFKWTQKNIGISSVVEILKPALLCWVNRFYEPGVGELMVPKANSLYAGNYTMEKGEAVHLYDNIVPLSKYLPAYLRDLAVFPGKGGFAPNENVVDRVNRVAIAWSAVPKEFVGRNDVMLAFDSCDLKEGWRFEGMPVLVPAGMASAYEKGGKGWPIEFPEQPTVAPLTFNFDKEKGFFVQSGGNENLYSIVWFGY